jgi:phage gp36-like protein
MTTRFTDKEPADVVTLSFDFTADADSVSAPQVSIAVVSGTDPDPALMLIGAPTAAGAIVYQRVQGGVNGALYSLQCLAYNGDDRYSIEALLPIRARPIVSAAVPRYITEAQFEQRFGISEMSDLLANGASFGESENDAASLIDGYLAARYSLPLVSVPTIVTGWAADITRFKLWGSHAPEEVRKRYDDALAQLRLVATGTIALPPGSDGTPAAAPVVFAGYSAARVFTSDSLTGF